jgi:hypothetical protein
MKTLTRSMVALAAVVGLAGPAGLSVTSPAGATVEPCAVTWGSLPKAAGSLSPAPLIAARAGQHDCYDSLVFELNGPANGYRVAYADEVYSQGQGVPLSPYAGRFGALIGITLLDPAYDVGTGAPTYTPVLPDVSRYQTFRGIAWGGSFEGYTTFALGVRARLPFEVLVLPGPGTHTRFVVNVAHRWVV